MTKEFNEILVVDKNDLAKAARDHRRRWVFRILGRSGVDIPAAKSLYPENEEIVLRAWSDFLIRYDLELFYYIKEQELRLWNAASSRVLGFWREPRPVRSKAHRPDQSVLLFTYSEPV